MPVTERQYLLALPSDPGPSGRQDLEEFAAWFDIVLLGPAKQFLQDLPTLGAPYLPFIACLTAVDILSGYRYGKGALNRLFVRFIREYFPATYDEHAEVLYECRKAVVHEFSPGRRTILVHKSTDIHLSKLEGRVVFCADELAADTAMAADAFFEHVRRDEALLSTFRTRAGKTAGGTMGQLFQLQAHTNSRLLGIKRLP